VSIEEAETSPLPSVVPAYAALVLAVLIASGTFLVAKETTRVFDPIALGWFRIELSFLLIFVLYRLRYRGREKAPLTRGDLWRLVVSGLSGVSVNQMLFLLGISYSSPTDAALIFAFTPVAVLLGARFLYGETLSLTKVLGIALAIFGGAIVLTGRGLSLDDPGVLGNSILMIAMLAWSSYTLLGKELMRRTNALRANFYAFGVAALSLLPFSWFVLADFDWTAPGWSGWIGLFYLAGLTSTVAFTLWTWALERLEASQVAVFTNVQPALTAFLAWVFLGDVPTLAVVIGGVLVIGGVVLVQRRRR